MNNEDIYDERRTDTYCVRFKNVGSAEWPVNTFVLSKTLLFSVMKIVSFHITEWGESVWDGTGRKTEFLLSHRARVWVADYGTLIAPTGQCYVRIEKYEKLVKCVVSSERHFSSTYTGLSTALSLFIQIQHKWLNTNELFYRC